MHVSHETEFETSARLQQVAARTRLHVLDGEYWFDEFSALEAAARFRSDALAMVRDGERWSQLVPVKAADAVRAERFRIWSCHFPAGLDNSGFVGWLATALKSQTGSGVFVVCGQTTDDGGIFDYWGCPAEAAGTVLPCVQRLLRRDAVRGAEPVALSLDGLVLRAVRCGPQSVVGPETVLLLSQRDGAVRGRYAGGAIDAGVLVGQLSGPRLSFRYTQIDRERRTQSGTSMCHVERDPSGAITITERYTSDAGVVGENIFESIAGVPG